MFWFIAAYITLPVILGALTLALYKVTYPPCHSRRCTHHTTAA